MKTILRSGAALVASLFLISWGVVGHRTIGQIADDHLSKKAKAAVKDLLGSESLAMVSTYPDEIRSDPQYAYTSPWHYVNLSDGLSATEFKEQLTTIEKPNIYKAILDCTEVLKAAAKTRDDKVFALKFLVHLVGDLHQPMHTGRSEDAGGNQVKVKFMRRETNLHSLWDGALVDYTGMTYSELAKSCGKVSKQQLKRWQADPADIWAYESYAMSQQLYAEAAANPSFNYDYYPRHAEFMKTRLAQAGIRLAGLLNEIYK